jgi:glycosyltransferase involved in cell wall biosynthesis
MASFYSRILRVHPVLKDLTVTAGASLVNFVASLLVISMFGRLLGLTLLAEYLLLRRVAAWLQPVTHLGLGVGLPRFVAHSTKESRECQLEYFAATILAVLSFTTVLGVTLWLARIPLGKLFFGSTQLSSLVIPLFLLLLGSAAQIAVYGYYRGLLKMKRAGALQICASLAPIISAALLFRTHSVAMIVSSIGWALLAVAFFFVLPILNDLWKVDVHALPTRAKELLRYGVSRVPGDIGTGALLAVGPMLASHYVPVSRVSFLLIATGMLLAATVSTDPLGLVFLSKISMMLAHSRMAEVQTYLTYLMSAIIDISVFVTIQMLVFTDVLVRIWIGNTLSEGIPVIRIVLVGTPFYMFFTGLRSAIDAGTVRAVNARNVVCALVALLAMIGANTRLVSNQALLSAIALSLLATFVLIAYLTHITLNSVFQIRANWKESTIPVFCAFVLGGIAYAYHGLGRESIVELAIFEIVLMAIFTAVCFYSRTPWFRLVWNMAFPNVSPTPEEPVKITHLSSVHPPDDNRIFKMCRSVASTGRVVSFVVPTKSDDFVDGVFIKAVPKTSGRLSRMIGTTWQVYQRAIKERADVYQFHDPELLPVGLALQHLHKRAVIYDVHENVPEQILTKSYIPLWLRKLIARGFNQLELFAAARYSAIVTANEDLNDRFDPVARQVVAIHNYADDQEFSSLAASNSRYTSGVVIHSAASDRTSFPAVVQALELLPNNLCSRLIATAVTEYERESAKEMVKQCSFGPIELTGIMPREELARSLSQCAVSLVLYGDQRNHSSIRSNRLFESLAAAAPVIVSDFPEWRAYVESIGCGICADPQDPRSIAQALTYLLSHPNEASAMGARGRRAFLGTLNWSVERNRLVNLYDSLLKANESEPEVAITMTGG